MLKRLCTLLFFCNALVAQEQHLQVSNINEFKKDTTEISRSVSAAKELRHIATDSGIFLYQQAFLKSRAINYTDGIARSLTGLGLFYMDKGDYNKSLAYYKLAMPYCEKAPYAKGVLIVALYNNIAALYGNRGIQDSAAYYYYKALEQMDNKKIKDTTLLLLIYSNLGGRLASDNQLEQAVFYLDRGEEIAVKTGNKKMLAKFYVDLATLYSVKKEYNKGIFYAEKALDLFKQFKDPASEIVANCIIGSIFLERKMPQKALSYYQRCFSENFGSSVTQLAIAYRGIGACYYALKNYSSAKENYLKALEIAKTAKLNKGMLECYKALENIYTDLTDYKSALAYTHAYADLNDSTLNAEKIQSLNQLEVKYRTSEKDKELAEKKLLLNRQNNQLRVKNMLMISGGGVSLLLILLFITLYRSRKHKQDLKIRNMQKEREVGQLKAMMTGEERERTRIAQELHDGIMVELSAVQMNLNTIVSRTSDNILSEKLDTILKQLNNTTKDLRKSAHNLMPNMLLKEGLAEATHYFCKSLQDSVNIEIDFQLYGEIPRIAPEFELMLYRIIQELLQNTIKHAKATYVLVQINCEPDILHLLVEDNGVGFDEEKLKKNDGIGVKGIKARVNSLNGRIQYSTKEGEGTSVYIELDTDHLQKTNEEYANKNSNY